METRAVVSKLLCKVPFEQHLERGVHTSEWTEYPQTELCRPAFLSVYISNESVRGPRATAPCDVTNVLPPLQDVWLVPTVTVVRLSGFSGFFTRGRVRPATTATFRPDSRQPHAVLCTSCRQAREDHGQVRAIAGGEWRLGEQCWRGQPQPKERRRVALAKGVIIERR